MPFTNMIMRKSSDVGSPRSAIAFGIGIAPQPRRRHDASNQRQRGTGRGEDHLPRTFCNREHSPHQMLRTPFRVRTSCMWNLQHAPIVPAYTRCISCRRAQFSLCFDEPHTKALGRNMQDRGQGHTTSVGAGPPKPHHTHPMRRSQQGIRGQPSPPARWAPSGSTPRRVCRRVTPATTSKDASWHER